MCLEATQQRTVPLDRNMSQSSRRVLPFFSKALFLGFLLAFLRAVDVLKPEGRQRSGFFFLKSQVALLSTVVLTSTETCQARSLALGQGQTLQER